MPQPPHLDLTGIRETATVDEAADATQVALLIGVANLVFQLIADVEVILQRPLATSSDNGDLIETCLQGFLHSVLNQRLVDHWQHFLGHSLGSWKESGAVASCRKQTFLDHGHPWFARKSERCGVSA